MSKTHDLDYILSRTKQDGDCMIWQGGVHKQGYGMMRQTTEMRTVHSVVAELKYGRRPSKYTGDRVSRTCDNLLCCNPDHIVILSTGNIRYNGNGKFTDDEIREIRATIAADKTWGAKSRLARKLGIAPFTLTKILNGTSYSWVK